MKPWVSQAEMVARIEATRIEEAPPRCPACSCTAKHNPETRRCLGMCGKTLPIELFTRDRSQPLGRSYECLDCAAARQRIRRQNRKRRQFRALLSAVAS